MFKLRQSFLYMLIFTVVASGFTMLIVVKAYSNVDKAYAQYQ